MAGAGALEGGASTGATGGFDLMPGGVSRTIGLVSLGGGGTSGAFALGGGITTGMGRVTRAGEGALEGGASAGAVGGFDLTPGGVSRTIGLVSLGSGGTTGAFALGGGVTTGIG